MKWRIILIKMFLKTRCHKCCHGCHDLTILSANISDIATIAVKNIYYRCIINNISKSEVIHSFFTFFD